jgi:ribosomal protein L37AE/L43A
MPMVMNIIQLHNKILKKHNECKIANHLNRRRYIKVLNEINKNIEDTLNKIITENDCNQMLKLKNKILILRKNANKIKKILRDDNYQNYKEKSKWFILKNDTDIPKIHKYINNLNYLMEYDDSKNSRKLIKTNIYRKCKNCGSMSHFIKISSGIDQCKRCMYILNDITENIVCSNNNISVSTKSNTYKKINYFESCFNKFRMLSVPKNPDKIVSEIKKYADEFGIKKFNIRIVRSILKKINRSSSYKYATYYTYRLNNIFIPLNISNVDYEKMKKWFSEVVEVWTKIFSTEEDYKRGKNKLSKKKSFFGYPYIMRKLLELLDRECYDKCLHLIPLDNSSSNIDKNDRIWKIICEELNYEFIPTYIF